MQNQKIIMLILCMSSLGLVACDSKKVDQTAASDSSAIEAKAEVLPYLNLQPVKADYALPFCEKKNCIEIDIQTLKTQDPWMNQWIAANQSSIIQRQIDLKQNMTLQQAINAYVKKSDAWQDDFSQNKAYELHMQTRMASQRNQYVLLQISVHSLQAGVSVKERQYFFVGDRKLKKSLSILDVIQADKQNQMNIWVQKKYQAWLDQQTQDVKSTAPKKIFWGQADWFFDGEGIGLHYRASEIVQDGAQLDIYFTKQQTQQILKPEIYQQMF
ncbi:hypothetical protein [Acinetobacter sp. ANC 4648]|uniref:hypothetical protein n=1 Tax=Acinetobacter sp. ANC 4648 TaxID=1977875 RepID=UPI000A35C1A6|nr:hypothetical protein [Acinetobacter sp. ANC 4648]OTG83986.1 hypothetical protein B9T27_05670 [Acinetobacter sp. ANC 4648]